MLTNVPTCLMLCGLLALLSAFGSKTEANGDVKPDKNSGTDQFYEILHGEHLNDVLYNLHQRARTNVLLLMYEPSCQNEADQWALSLLDLLLPPFKYLFLFGHDWVTSRQAVWFQYTEMHDLKQRFGIKACPSLVFIKQGSHQWDSTQYKIWDKNLSTREPSLLAWLRDLCLCTLQIRNHLNYSLVVKVESNGFWDHSQEEVANILAEDMLTMHLPVGQAVLVFKEDGMDFFNGWTVSEVNQDIHLNESSKAPFKSHMNKLLMWQTQLVFQEESLQELTVQYLMAHDMRIRTMIHQPLVVPAFNQKGYYKMKIPQVVHEKLLEKYELNKNTLEDEYYHKFYTFWNLDEITMMQVTLTEEEVFFISTILKPIAEEWCHCDLVLTTGPGIVTRIRKYPNGARVRMHVDQMETGHVIGVILQVTQDLSSQDQWPLVLIGSNGQREEIVTNPGDMVLFEASRIIHGRPSVYRGQYYINNFFYFQPKSGIDYESLEKKLNQNMKMNQNKSPHSEL